MKIRLVLTCHFWDLVCEQTIVGLSGHPYFETCASYNPVMSKSERCLSNKKILTGTNRVQHLFNFGWNMSMSCNVCYQSMPVSCIPNFGMNQCFTVRRASMSPGLSPIFQVSNLSMYGLGCNYKLVQNHGILHSEPKSPSESKLRREDPSG